MSASGQYVLLGSGDIYNQNGLTWSGSLGFAGGRCALVRERLAGHAGDRQQPDDAASPERHQPRPARAGVVHRPGACASWAPIRRWWCWCINNGTVQFHSYVPNDDSDNDGVLNAQDAFPLDRAASVDTDRDGYPDAWNAGRTQADSTTGLTLDSFPAGFRVLAGGAWHGWRLQLRRDHSQLHAGPRGQRGQHRLSTELRQPACVSLVDRDRRVSEPVHRRASTRASAPSRRPRWRIRAPTSACTLGYDTGAIRYLDVNAASPAEVAVRQRGDGGRRPRVRRQLRARAGLQRRLGDALRDQQRRHHHRLGGVELLLAATSPGIPSTSRVYFFRDDISPNDLHYEVIDQTTGQIASAGETPYHGDYGWSAPIRVSPDGEQILIGGGNFYQPRGIDARGLAGQGDQGRALDRRRAGRRRYHGPRRDPRREFARGAAVLSIPGHTPPPGVRPVGGVPGARHERHDGIRAAALLRPGCRSDSALVGGCSTA